MSIKTNYFILPVLFLFALVTQESVVGDVIMSSRSSNINYTYTHGFGGSTLSGSPSFSSNSLVNSDTFSQNFSQPNSGAGWTSSVSANISHSFSISPFPSGVGQITGSGSTAITASSTSPAIAQVLSSGPGNRLILEFNIDALQPYSMTGSVVSTQSNSSAGVRVVLQRFNGIAWVTSGFDTLSLPGSLGNLSTSGLLNPGAYRILASSANTISSASSLTSQNSSFSFNFSAVPEPSCGILASLMALTFPFYRRKKLPSIS
jgi:hypothetical protein